MHEIFTACVLGFILAFTIGPVFFVLIETSITKGFRSAIAFDLGVVLADIVYIGLAFYATNKLVERIKDDPNFIIGGGVLLVIYGLVSYLKTSKTSYRQILREHHEAVEVQKKQYGQLFVKGFLLNFINIGVLLGWLGFIVIANSVSDTPQGVFVFLGTILVSYFVTDLGKIFLSKKLKNKLTPRRIFKTKRLIALMILGFGLLLVVQGFFPEQKEKLRDRLDETIKISPVK
ncbi:MAG: LysE family translocator [Flavobacteriaceae bacterium]|nr:LysE family translocator [Flavobacteriaceae bacterium]